MATTNEPLGGDPTPVDTGWIPTDPEAYDTSQHYEGRANDPDRVISDDLATELIETGTIHRESGGKWSFRKEIDGMDLRVYCVLADGLVPMAVTGYAVVNDLQVAKKSARFSKRAVKCEHFRNLIAQDSWPHELRWVRLKQPTNVEGHALTTESGVRHVECAGCGHVFRKWEKVRRLDCA